MIGSLAKSIKRAIISLSTNGAELSSSENEKRESCAPSASRVAGTVLSRRLPTALVVLLMPVSFGRYPRSSVEAGRWDPIS